MRRLVVLLMAALLLSPGMLVARPTSAAEAPNFGLNARFGFGAKHETLELTLFQAGQQIATVLVPANQELPIGLPPGISKVRVNQVGSQVTQEFPVTVDPQGKVSLCKGAAYDGATGNTLTLPSSTSDDAGWKAVCGSRVNNQRVDQNVWLRVVDANGKPQPAFHLLLRFILPAYSSTVFVGPSLELVTDTKGEVQVGLAPALFLAQISHPGTAYQANFRLDVYGPGQVYSCPVHALSNKASDNVIVLPPGQTTKAGGKIHTTVCGVREVTNPASKG